MYILALGTPTHPIPDWYLFEWYETYKWEKYFGTEYVAFGPLFVHQYSHCWIDFRNIQDRYMWAAVSTILKTPVGQLTFNKRMALPTRRAIVGTPVMSGGGRRATDRAIPL